MAKFLVVDDSNVARKILNSILIKLGHEIIAQAETGEKAILEYRKNTPDIVMMDVDMPGIGGIEAAKRIIGVYPYAKVIIVSAHVHEELKVELSANGLQNFISKPVTSDKVSDALNKLLSKELEKDKLNKAAKKMLVEAPKSSGNPPVQESIFEGMGIQPEHAVTVNHYYVGHLFKSRIMERIMNTLTLKLPKGFSIYNFAVGDPVIIGIALAGEDYICEANVVKSNASNTVLIIEVESVLPLKNERILDNFPTSLSTDLKEEKQNKKHPAIIKKVGINSMLISAKTEFYPGEKFIFDLILNNNVVSLDIEIVLKVQGKHNFNYDVAVLFSDYNNKKFFRSCMQKIMEEQVKAIAELNI